MYYFVKVACAKGLKMNVRNDAKKVHILAYGSKGGHWDQLMLLRPAFASAHQVTYATNDTGLAAAYGLEKCEKLSDYSRSRPLDVLLGVAETYSIIRRLKPNVVVSTGAAPGLLLLLWGRLTGAKTIWIDSIANAESPSLSGRLANKFAHCTLTQWEHLAKGTGFKFWGSVL